MRTSIALLLLLGSSSAAATCSPLLAHTLPNLTDQATSLCQFQGKVLLVVNTASECGYTPQYAGLEALYRRYREAGLVVLGFPANDFGGQEPGSNREIARFCEINYGVSFPMFAKSRVRSDKVNPFFAALITKTGERPQWNFHKYLIDRSGHEVLSFGTRVTPEDRKLVGEIERMIAAPAPKF